MRFGKNIFLALALAVAAAAGWGGARALDTPPRSNAAAATCATNPLTGVHDPQRLQILSACATFVGTVRKTAERAPDRDLTFSAAPDPAYASMLNAKNRSGGGIHVEIIPIDQAGCTSGCSGAKVATPPLGAHVRLTGAHVYDRWVGWNEIHPVWKIEILSGSPPPPPPPPPTPPKTFRLKASLTGKGLGRSGARRGHGRVVLTLTAERACWRFTKLARIGRPTRAGIRFKQEGKPGHTVLALGRRYRPRGCVAVDATLFESLVDETRDYYVLVASKRHPYGAVRGQLSTA